MRSHPLAALSLVALSALVLAGCAGSGSDASTTEARPTSTEAPVDLCDAAAPTGDAVEAVTVEGEAGAPATATFTTPLTVDALQRTVITEGTGDELQSGDLVSFGFVGYSADSGEELGAVGYEPGQALPVQISPDSVLGQIFGCGPIGSRVVAAFPAADQTAAQVYVMDVLGTVPSRAEGEPQTPTEGFPTVTLDDDGAPTIDVAGVSSPTTTQVEVLQKGSGETVASGDQVLVQYTGVLLSDGSVFDSSWVNGAPVAFTTTGVVAGFGNALVGQTAGSQIVAVIPPAEGYGDADQGAIPAGSTLVFVIDVLAVAHATAAQ